MYHSKKVSLIILLVATVLNSCVMGPTIPKQVDCPIIETQCLPTKWKGISYDTSFASVQYLDKYFVFEPVQQINSEKNEWSLSFINSKKAILTYNDMRKQKLVSVKMIKDNRGLIESGIGSTLEGSTGTFSAQGGKVYFAHEAENDLLGNSDIYSAVLSGNILVDAKPISGGINLDQYTWEAQPSVGLNGNVLFFASDRAYGKGGSDIWYSIKKMDGSWSEPINCGDEINTACPELTPFMSGDGSKLYFSSMGHETVGGYDIFVSEVSDSFADLVQKGDWKSLKDGTNFFGKAKNMRPPLNTDRDELFPSFYGDSDSLFYYSSNQGKRDFDIYVRRVIIREKKQEEKKPDAELAEEKTEIKIPDKEIKLPTFYTVQGKVINASTNEVLPGADITAVQKPDMTVYKNIKSDAAGDYNMLLQKDQEYQLTAQSQNLFFDSYSINIESTDTNTIVSKNFLVPVVLTLRINFPTDIYDEPYQFTLDSNGFETGVKWNEDLDNLAKNIIDSRDKIDVIKLSGHTDDVASEQYNYNLGLKRVKFVIDELIKRGVPKELLNGRSAGKRELLPKRQDEDINIYRKRQRRVELKKLLK